MVGEWNVCKTWPTPGVWLHCVCVDGGHQSIDTSSLDDFRKLLELNLIAYYSTIKVTTVKVSTTLEQCFSTLILNITAYILFQDIAFLYARSKTSDVLWYGVRPSVRLSVCPSVSHIMSAQYLEKFMSDSHGT